MYSNKTQSAVTINKSIVEFDKNEQLCKRNKFAIIVYRVIYALKICRNVTEVLFFIR